MKRYLPLAAVVLLVGVIIQRAYSSFSEATFNAQRDANMSRIQQEYLERVGWLRVNPEEKDFRADSEAFFQWYFKQIADHHQRFGGNPKFDSYLTELEERQASGQQDPQLAQKKQAFKDTFQVMEAMRGGTYAPMWTSTDKGMRLDLHPSRVERVDDEDVVVIPLVLWGAQRELREESRGLKKMVTSASFSATVRLLDEKGRLYGELDVSGDPAGKVDFPERLIAEFPPQMVLGRYELPLVPAQVKRMEMTITVSSTPSYGRPAQARYEWKLDVPSEWKLRPGESWKGAEVSERSEEEIDPSRSARDVP